MKTTLKLVLMTFFLVKIETVKKCQQSSFTSLSVVITENKNEFKTETVKRCISPDTLLYNENALKLIQVFHQTIPVLKKGFVNNITDAFALEVSHNSIDNIEEEAFLNLPLIKAINLDHNGVQWIETNAFFNLPTLKSIDLTYNNLEQLLQNTFNNLPNLEVLKLNLNNLKSFQQDCLWKTVGLKDLHLNNNQISSLSRAAFITLPNLRNIDLSYNQISHAHKDAFEGLQLLSELILEGNLLKTIDITFSGTPQIKTLSISDNNLTYVSNTFLNTMEKYVNTLWINGNPWQCGCLDKIIQWGARTNIPVSWKCNQTELSCVIPKKRANQCSVRSDQDFYSDSFAPFTKKCDKIIE